MFKFTLAQINPTIGDIEGNLALMKRAAQQAHSEGAALVIFPEMSLTAYYPADLLDDTEFLKQVARGLENLLATSRELPDLYWVVGAPTPHTGMGKRLYNSLIVIKAGEVLRQYHKQLLPTYNIFDERRHFEPGPDVAQVLRIGNARIGFMICEDGWNDESQEYEVNPFLRLAAAAPDLVISINASPSNVGKREQRHEIFSRACARHGLSLVYVNQIGGHDQVVYDGASFAVDPERGVVFEAQRFVTDVVTLSFDPDAQHFFTRTGELLPPPSKGGLSVCEFYRRQIVLGLKDYARRCGFTTAVVGSSGGIDSALTLALAVEALGAPNVVAITMPSAYSSTGSVSDSEVLCRNLGIPLLTHPIRELVEGYKAGFERATQKPLVGLALENLQARIRGTILMEYSNSFGPLLLTTGNKSEISVGYCTLYGDTNGGLGVIGDIYKTEVFALSRHINETAGREIIPTSIIEKAPSAELAPGQKDTDSLPPYEVLDEVLKILIEGDRLAVAERAHARMKFEELAATADGQALIARVRKMIGRNEYKRRQAPPILRVRARAFGSGRQMPIAAHY
ncbi:MAG: NAD+ synthase [Povalibacter sp.]